MRFGLWIMFGTPSPPEAIAIHLDHRMRRPGRPVSGRIRHGKSTHTRLWQGAHSRSTAAQRRQPDYPDVPGAGDLSGSPLERQRPPCYRNISRPIAGIVRLSQALANEITRLSILRAVGSLSPRLPPAFAYDSDGRTDLLYACRTFSPSPLCGTWPAKPDKAAAELSYATVLGETESLNTIDHGKNRSDRIAFAQTRDPLLEGQKRTNLRPGPRTLPFFRSGSVITLRPLRHEDLRRGAVGMAETVTRQFRRTIASFRRLRKRSRCSATATLPRKRCPRPRFMELWIVVPFTGYWLGYGSPGPVRRYPLWVLRRICRK